MLKLITTLTFFLFGLLAKGQVTENRTVTDFNKMEIKNATIIYTESNRNSVIIASDYNDASETIFTEVTNGTLKIKGVDTNENTVVYVTGKVTDFKLGSKAELTATNLITAINASIILNSGATFNGTLAGNNTSIEARKNSFFKGAVTTGSFKGDFSSNARIILCGSAKTAVITAKSGVLCHARNFISHNLQVIADGNSKVTAFSDESIGINVSENATVSYNGFPKKVNLNTTAVLNRKLKNEQLMTYNY